MEIETYEYGEYEKVRREDLNMLEEAFAVDMVGYQFTESLWCICENGKIVKEKVHSVQIHCCGEW